MGKSLALAAFVGLLSLDYAVGGTEGALAETRNQFPPVYEYLAQSGTDRPVLEFPVGRVGEAWYPYKYLHFQTGHWRPLLAGMSGWFPPSRYDLSKRTEDCPSVECFNFIRYTPAATLVVHLDKYPDAQRSAWEKADLSRFGFNFAGKFGSALVWERGSEMPPISDKLVVTDGRAVSDRGRERVGIALRPAENGKGWRYFGGVSSHVEVLVTTQQGEEIRLQRSIQLPAYLLPGEQVPSTLVLKPIPLAEVKRILLKGVLIEDSIIDTAPSSPSS